MSAMKDLLIEMEDEQLAAADWRMAHELTDEDHDVLAEIARLALMSLIADDLEMTA